MHSPNRINLPNLCETFIVLILTCTSLSFRVSVFQVICVILSFLLIGYCANRPNAIFKLKQGKEPWILEVQFPRQNNPGKLEIITCIRGLELVPLIFWNFFSRISFLNVLKLLEMIEDTWSAYVSKINHTSSFCLLI